MDAGLGVVVIALAQGDAVRIPLRDESVHLICTSLPYWNLRDYGIDGQIGLEETPELYIQHVVEVFREIKRVLRSDGTCWTNWGDSYQNKQLQGIPWRCALALQADGWWLRSDIIWAKGLSFCPTYSGSSMPESVKDRPSTSHEHLFLLTKSKTYYYDQEAIREPHQADSLKRYEYGLHLSHDGTGLCKAIGQGFQCERMGDHVNPAGRNLRSVWAINPQGYKGNHFATYPVALVEPCIKTSPTRCCPVCGAGWKRVTKPVGEYAEALQTEQYSSGGLSSGNFKGASYARVSKQMVTIGWRPSCNCYGEPQRGPVKCEKCGGTGEGAGLWVGEPCPHCNGTGYTDGDIWPDDVEDWPTVPAIVLDPFAGSCTTGIACRKLHRDFIGLDLSLSYLRDQARKRLSLSALDGWYSTDAKDGEGESLDDLPLFTGIV